MQLIVKLATYAAGRKLHLMILLGVLHAPMSFFDTTPIGRIINRFAKDIDAVDSTLSDAFSDSLMILITVVATLVILIYGSWFVIIGLIPLTILFAFIQVKFFFVVHEKLSLRIYSVFIYRLLVKFAVLIQLHVVRSFQISAKPFKVLVQFEHIMFNSASSMCVIS
jgi:ABC-type multidrug transport system fused ATPase/permease subunit